MRAKPTGGGCGHLDTRAHLKGAAIEKGQCSVVTASGFSGEPENRYVECKKKLIFKVIEMKDVTIPRVVQSISLKARPVPGQ